MKRPPKLCRNKFNGTAFITVNGKQVYLGKWGSEKAQAAYERFLLNWLKANRENQQLPKDPRGGFTVAELVVAFVADYRKRPVKSQADLKTFIRVGKRLESLFPRQEADSFRIRDLEILRDSFQDEGFTRKGEHQDHSRTYLNKLVSRAKMIFSWGTSKEMVSAETVARLKFLQPLRKGHTTAPEPPGHHLISDKDYKAVLPFLPAYYKDIVEVLHLTGMRPSELCNMRVCDIDRSGKIWIYQPEHHKTEHSGATRIIGLGKKTQAVLRKHLAKRGDDEYVFTPARAMESRWKIQRKQRKSPLQPSQVEREKQRASGKMARFKPKLDAPIITKRVKAACNMALKAKKISQAWTPYDLRHTAITDVRTKYGAESAQHFAGHSNLYTQKYYDHSALEAASKVAEEIG